MKGSKKERDEEKKWQEGQMKARWVKDLFITYVINMYKLYYVPGSMLNAINSIISFRTNLRDNICDKYSIEKICSLGSSGHLKLIQLPNSEQKQP